MIVERITELGLPTMTAVRLAHLIEMSVSGYDVQRLRAGEPPHRSLAYDVEGGVLGVYARDEMESELDAGGSLVLAVDLNQDPRTWR